MNAVDQSPAADADAAEFDLVDDAPFFPPVASDLFDGLVGEYQARRAQIEQVAGIMNGGALSNVVHYFIEGNAADDRRHGSIDVGKLFATAGAVNSLNAAFWSKALAMTDVYACMPQERKNQWNTQLRNPAGVKAQRHRFERESASPGKEWDSEPLPDFEEGTVRATIGALLNMRGQFLAERVDGIFRALSGEHVTNAPEAFGKRMIVSRIFDSFGMTNYDRVGYLHDLRCVIAKFMGREEPVHQGTTDKLVTTARHRSGKWVVADGGALKIRVYQVGTAHVQVHPDMAWRLNVILANLHPLAIPAQFRQRRRPSKEFAAIGRPLPFAVLDLIADMSEKLEQIDDFRDRTRRVPLTRKFGYGSHDKQALAEATRVIESIGGVRTGAHFTFDYEPAEVLSEITLSGCIPDHVSHQFYPTPEPIARAAVDLAEIGLGDLVLEPSAGNGDLAMHLPADRTRCVELSSLRCSVLKARGLDTVQADFLAWAAETAERFDRIVMNPPFSDQRWKLHTVAAAALIRPCGRLVAVLPTSARHALVLPGFECEWSRTYENAFAGTSASVVILVARKL